MSEELKPLNCPYCGGKMRPVWSEMKYERGRNMRCKCDKCLSYGPLSGIPEGGFARIQQSEIEAIRLCNTRAEKGLIEKAFKAGAEFGYRCGTGGNIIDNAFAEWQAKEKGIRDG